ncbi:MAG: hypothetical protein ACTSW1_19145 [Candidatus Hodarchaeales archaeon]
MVNIITLSMLLLTILLINIVLRYFSLAPTIVSYFIIRRQNSDKKIAIEPTKEYQIVELPIDNQIVRGLFFNAPLASAGSILIVPDWTRPDDIQKNIETASILRGFGYDVFLPIFHDINFETGKINNFVIDSRKLYKIIENSFHYLLTRSEGNRRAVALYSNSMGTYLACFLVKDYAIRSVVLEDGPVSLTNLLLAKIGFKRNLISHLLRFTVNLLVYPLTWRTKWDYKRAIKLLRCTPTFLIASKEDTVYSSKNIWQNYARLYKPRQIWLEHSILPKTLQHTWRQEYEKQISTFYSLYVKEEIQPEYHFDFTTKRKQKGKYPVEIKITAMPPQLKDIPVQITLSGGSKIEELRLIFNGASMILTKHLDFKPRTISLLHFYNVKKHDIDPHRHWIKQHAAQRLIKTLDLVLESPLEELEFLIDRYFYIKMILLYEEGKEEKLVQKQRVRVSRKYIKSQIKHDPDGRHILSITTSY